MTQYTDEFFLQRLRSVSNPIILNAGFPVAGCFKKLNLVEIPGVMHARGLVRSAMLMEKWFSGKKFVLPEKW